MTPLRRLLAGAVAAATLAAGLAGCGGSAGGSSGASSTGADATTTATGATTGVALTDAQASILARVLYRNLQGGGAAFEADLPARGQVVATLSGQVDWVGHVAAATYAATDGTASTADYVWNGDIVLDGGVTGLEQAMAAEGRPGIRWVSRPLDPTTAPLDGVLALILISASTKPDNPQLLARSARYLGRRTVDGTRVDAFRYQANITYFVGVADHLVHRMSAVFKGFSDPVVLRFSDRRPRAVSSPQAATVVDASTIPEIYRRLTGHAAPTRAAPRPTTGTSTVPG